MENILKKICNDKKEFLVTEKRKKNINFLIKNTSKKKKVKTSMVDLMIGEETNSLTLQEIKGKFIHH